MWSMNVLILLLFCYACLSTGNMDVFFNSTNFNNVLHWKRPKDIPSGEKVLYTVKYKSYIDGQPYQIKKECENITVRLCDLTRETPPGHDVYYYAQVFANGRHNGTSLRLNLIEDTHFSSATLTTKIAPFSLQINVSLPLGPNGVSVADLISRSKKNPIEVEYILEITSPYWAMEKHKGTSGSFNIKLGQNNVEYCGYVYYLPSTERIFRPTSEKAAFCMTMPDVNDKAKHLPWLITGLVLLAVVVTVSCASCWIYIKGGKESMPSALRNITIHSAYDPTFESPIISKLQTGPFACTSGGYSPQDVAEKPWTDSSGFTVDTSDTGEEEPDSSCQSSVVYASLAARAPGEETSLLIKTGPQPVYADRKTLTLTNLKQTTPLPSVDEEESVGGLLLRTVRDENGQLVLPLFDFQFQNSQDETQPNTVVHLSDLFETKTEEHLQRLSSQDSGCDSSDVTPTPTECTSNYCPNFAPGSYQAHSNIQAQGRRKNWMTDAKFRSTLQEDEEEHMLRFDRGNVEFNPHFIRISDVHIPD